MFARVICWNIFLGLFCLFMMPLATAANYDCLAPAKTNVINLSSIEALRQWQARKESQLITISESDLADNKLKNKSESENRVLEAFASYLHSSSQFFVLQYNIAAEKGVILYLPKQMKAGKNIIINSGNVVLVQCEDKVRPDANVLFGNNLVFANNMDVIIKGDGCLIIEDGTVIEQEIQLEILDNEVVVINSSGITRLTKGEQSAIDYKLSRVFPADTYDKQSMILVMDSFMAYLSGDLAVEMIPEKIETRIDDVFPVDEGKVFKAELDDIRQWNMEKLKYLGSEDDVNIHLLKEQNNKPAYEPRLYLWEEGAVKKREKLDYTAMIFSGKIEEIRKIIEKKQNKKTLDVQHFKIPRWIKTQT